MSVETGLRAYFLADNGVKDLIGNRVYPHEAAHGADLPYLVYTLHEHHQTRTLTGTPGKQRWVYTLSSCADSYAEAKALRDAVKAALPGAARQDLGGVVCDFYVAEDSDHDLHSSQVDKSRFQMALDVEILER